MCKKNCTKTELNVLWHSTVFPSGLSVFCQFCVPSSLLFASHIGDNVRKEEKKA
jgi:hypothetical protein